MRELVGVAVSPGVAHGRAYVLVRHDLAVVEGVVDDIEAEKGRVEAAAAAAVSELSRLVESVRGDMGVEFAHIIRSQQTIAEDEAIIGEVMELVESEKLCAEVALTRVFDGYKALFAELADDDYNKARGADIEDVYKRILRCLLGLPEISLADLEPGTIVVADDLYPSDTVGMDPAAVVGMITQGGGPTSHASILSKNLGIPAAVQVADILDFVSSGDEIAFENGRGTEARILVQPDAAETAAMHARARQLEARRSRLAEYRGREPRTIDGTLITLSANVGSTEDLAPAAEAGATSVGLYRSEFLFLHSPDIPDEERQYGAYRRAVEAFPDGFVIFRTLDIGGDKTLPAISLPEEANPFLGRRALRFCLSQPDLFRTQLRAILRAGAHGNAKIMFPMVGGVEELDEALAHLEAVKEELEEEEAQGDGVLFDREMDVGIMVEVPSAVLVADALAERVAFFSIGTNDLTQYLLAADRLNADVAEYYRTLDRSVFCAVRMVVEAARRHDCWVGVCGELGGNPVAAGVLLGLGVRELSMSPGSLDEISWLVCTSALTDFEELANRVLSLDSHREIEEELQRYLSEKE